ncbi:hypothetical protein PS9374_04900 [Planomonospora sphaerica]|uniref:Uncharacterized protein n=1 Tax=Planomonospora sphaerica TaxID=161355 RepID=A0A171DK75_9ACTN|nr:hypothetical protein PS9374_04900 [Planomonospora sphaerica]
MNAPTSPDRPNPPDRRPAGTAGIPSTPWTAAA